MNTSTSPLLEAYAAAEEAWREALQTAASNHGDWGHVQQAHQIVKMCKAALRAEAEKQYE